MAVRVRRGVRQYGGLFSAFIGLFTFLFLFCDFLYFFFVTNTVGSYYSDLQLLYVSRADIQHPDDPTLTPAAQADTCSSAAVL